MRRGMESSISDLRGTLFGTAENLISSNSRQAAGVVVPQEEPRTSPCAIGVVRPSGPRAKRGFIVLPPRPRHVIGDGGHHQNSGGADQNLHSERIRPGDQDEVRGERKKDAGTEDGEPIPTPPHYAGGGASPT